MLRLLITRALPGSVLVAARMEFDVTCRTMADPMSVTECATALGTYDLILPTLGDAFSAAAFEQAGPSPRARLLANFGVGYNHIDVAAARAAGVAVTNTPGAVTDATADIALTLILMTARRAGEGERLVRAGAWTGWQPTQMLGLHVSGKTVCIIGMGRIGQAVARRCHFGFGCRILYVNRSQKQVDFPAEQVTLTDGLARADIVVLATPGGAETHHLIGAEAFGAMQPHGIFVNISRGDVVDETALIAALGEGQIAGAGLDVYEFEPLVPVALRQMDQVVLLPHLGTAALEVRAAMGQMALDNCRAFARGAPLPNAV